MDKLKFISEQMDAIGIPYEFMQWNSPVVYPYFVGEITEEPTMTEDSAEESTLLLTGFHRGGEWLDLITAKETIKRNFDPNYGLRADTDSGSIAVFFDGFFPIPTDEADLKKIQINLKIKEWKGMN